MTIKQTYQTLLRLYPKDYRVYFAAEMLSTFMKAAEENRARGGLCFMRFASAELVGLVIGIATEWISKLTTDSAVRGRRLPDLRMMRPAGVPQRLWFAAPSTSHNGGRIQDELVETEKRIEIIIGQIVHAIAHHDFPNARWYSDQERGMREQLRRLQETRKITPMQR